MVVLVTGGCGYTGTVLVPKLLAAGYEVIVLDTMWFGNHLLQHPYLTVVKGDIRDYGAFLVDAIIHLAAVANDPTGDLDPKLTWEINALATMRLADHAARTGVKQFIYASSGSVYGVTDAPQVTEDLPLHPLSEYNKTKMVAERCVLSYQDQMQVKIVRPATVCGYSPRMRLDVVVNMLTMQALTKGVITVLGGNQVRPNIHIHDLTDLYVYLLDVPLTGIYNAGFENLTVLEIAELVKQFVPCGIEVRPSNDARSYRMNSDKLLKVFKPRFDVETAIMDVCAQYQAGKLKDEDRHYNLRAMP